MPTQAPTSPRQKFVELFRGLSAKSPGAKDDATSSCSLPCKANGVEFVAVHPYPEHHQFILEMPIGTLPKTNAWWTMEKLLTMNLRLLRQFGTPVSLNKNGEVVFRSSDSVSSIDQVGLKKAIEALAQARTGYVRAIASIKHPGTSK